MMTTTYVVKYRFDEGHKLAEFTPADAFLVYPLMVYFLLIR